MRQLASQQERLPPAYPPEPGLAPGPWDDPAVMCGTPWGSCWPHAGSRPEECPAGNTWGRSPHELCPGRRAPRLLALTCPRNQRDVAVEKGAFWGAGLNKRLLPEPCKG